MLFKKSIALLAVLSLLFCVFSVNASAEELETETITLAEYEQLRDFMPALMSASTAYSCDFDINGLRNSILNAVYNGDNELYITEFGLTVNDIDIVADLMRYNMPELLRAVKGLKYSYFSSSGIIARLIFTYEFDSAYFRRIYNEFETVANEMTSDLNCDDITDVQKALILHDRLAIKCEYDMDAADELNAFYEANINNSDAAPPWNSAFTAYGAIVDGGAICQGYTEAYEYLLEKVGIESERCRSENLNHIWNIVYINGRGYHVDVTWDDPVFANPASKPADYVQHNNFLVSSSALFSTGHNSYDYITTPNDTFFDNFFWQDFITNFHYANNHIFYYDRSGNYHEFNEKNMIINTGHADANNDGELNALDISSCRNIITDKSITDYSEYTSCDVTTDGKINVLDLVRYKRLLSYLS